MPKKFEPFNNDSQSVGLGELTLENQGEQVNLYGSATFTVDKDSLAQAKQLQQVLNDIVTYLESHGANAVNKADIKAAEQANVDVVKNPFL